MATQTRAELTAAGWTLNHEGSVSLWKKGTAYGILCSGSTFSTCGNLSTAQALLAKAIMLAALHAGSEVEGSELQSLLGQIP
tara:strand:+ start:425 stop:670 length:246 start_codon:yes stop_codon:yes gene_type:complete